MNTMFSPYSMGSLTLRNRFVRSATWEAMADTRGAVSDQLADLYASYARGGVGCIITGHTYVAREGKFSFRQTGSYADALGLEKLVHAAHAGNCPIVLQISHGGSASIPDDPVATPPVGPAPGEKCAGLDAAGMDRLITAFAAAARRGKKAGFDAVQVHFAHGFLLSEFLSPLFNTRTDEYGGKTENRIRFPFAVFDAVREAVGPDYPLLVKINSDDFSDGGMIPAEMVAICQRLEAAHAVTAIEISGGNRTGKFWPARLGKVETGLNSEGYYKEAARLYKLSVRAPLILVGGWRSLEAARHAVSEGLTDCISLSRPLIRESGLIARWMAGDTRPSGCLSCNGCYNPAGAGLGIRCTKFMGQL